MRWNIFIGRRPSVFMAAMVILATVAVYSGATSAPSVNWQTAEKNYTAALQSDNPGIRQSAVFHIGEYNLRTAVQPLITILKSDTHENVRMAAAFALIRLDDEHGRKAVEEASLYDGSDKVAQFCRSLLSVTSTGDSALR